MARSIGAQTATAIRKLLKQQFPNIKFRVTSDSGGWSRAVRVKWVNGPTHEQVRALVNEFEHGTFNGMIDLYEYNNRRDDIPQVDYVLCERHVTDDILNQFRRYGSTDTEAHRESWKLDLSHLPTTDADWAWLTRY